MRGPSRNGIAMVALFALSVFGVTLFFWKSFGGPSPLEPEGYRFSASFAQAANLQPNAAVRIAGVPVGKVVRVQRIGRRADALIQLESRFAPIPADVRAILRAKTLLGETFVELTPGSPTGPKLRDGGRLALAQVEPTTQLDQLLGMFDTRTRAGLKRFVRDLSAAVDARGLDLNAALGNLPPVVGDIDRVAAVLDAQRAAVGSLVRDTGVALDALGHRRAALQDLVTAGDEVFAATAARDRDLTATVRATPRFLRELRGALTIVARTGRHVAPAVHELRTAAPALRTAVAEARALAPRLEALFRGLGPVMAAARTGLPAATRMFVAARPLVDVLYPASRDIQPFYELMGTYRRDLATSLAKGAAATQASAPGPGGTPLHYLRTLLPIMSENLFGYGRRQPTNRHNAYRRPGALEEIARGGLRAFDCRNTSNPQQAPVIPPGAAPPPCLTQEPWRFNGADRSFPHVERAR